jgi:hypothetical protein
MPTLLCLTVLAGQGRGARVAALIKGRRREVATASLKKVAPEVAAQNGIR